MALLPVLLMLAAGTPTADQIAACFGDWSRLCAPELRPAPLRACFERHRAQVSKACRDAWERKAK